MVAIVAMVAMVDARSRTARARTQAGQHDPPTRILPVGPRAARRWPMTPKLPTIVSIALSGVSAKLGKPLQDRSPVLGTNYLQLDCFVPNSGTAVLKGLGREKVAPLVLRAPAHGRCTGASSSGRARARARACSAPSSPPWPASRPIY